LMLMLTITIKSPLSRMVMLSFYPFPPPLKSTLSILNPFPSLTWKPPEPYFKLPVLPPSNLKS
jgi:hypothetical protein